MKRLIGSTLAVPVLLVGGCGSGDDGAGAADRPDVPAPVSAALAPASATSLMPDEPPADPDVPRERQDGADLPPQIDPCRQSPPGQAGQVAGRQIIVVSKTGTGSRSAS